MKTIERYVFGSFLSSFLLALVVLSFVLTIGILVQIVGYIMDGVQMSLVWEFCTVSLPETLQWSMPLALLVSSVLVFSRLSADSEIAAMRACGVNIVTIMKWPLALALACTALGVYVNNEIVPRGHEVRRSLKSKVSVDTGLSVLEPGRIIDEFPKVKIYFASKEGNWLHDLIVMDYSTPGVDRMITAPKALVTQEGTDVSLDFYQMTVDPVDADHPGAMRFGRFRYTMKDVIKSSEYERGAKDFGFGEMIAAIDKARKRLADAVAGRDQGGGAAAAKFFEGELSEMLVELNKRFVFAMASICFVLVGIPLGIRSQRKESTIGMAISLAVSLGYYMIVILALSFNEQRWLHPETFIWLPVAACLAIAFRLVRRHM